MQKCSLRRRDHVLDRRAVCIGRARERRVHQCRRMFFARRRPHRSHRSCGRKRRQRERPIGWRRRHKHRRLRSGPRRMRVESGQRIEWNVVPDGTRLLCCTSNAPPACTTSTSCPGTRLECDSPNDCASGLCCRYEPNGSLAFSRCEDGICADSVTGPVDIMCRSSTDCERYPGNPYCEFTGTFGRCVPFAAPRSGVMCPDAPDNRCQAGSKCCLSTEDTYPRGRCVSNTAACGQGTQPFFCDDQSECGSCYYVNGVGSCDSISPDLLCNTNAECSGGTCNFGSIFGIYGTCAR